MASKHLTHEQQNFVRLSLAAVDEVRVVLGYVLHSQIPPEDLVKKIQGKKEILLKGEFKLKPQQKKLCYVPGPVVPDYKTFDITLLYKLIRNLCSSLQPSQGWGKEPRPTEINIGDDIERLRIFRNEIMIGNANSSSVSDGVFKSKWNELENIFKRIQGFLRTQGNTINLVEQLESVKRTDFGWQDKHETPILTLEGGEQKTCGESACFVVRLGDREIPHDWLITWHRIKGNITEQLDTSAERYKGSSSQRLVITKVSKEDEGEYQATASREEKGTHCLIPSLYLTVTGGAGEFQMDTVERVDSPQLSRKDPLVEKHKGKIKKLTESLRVIPPTVRDDETPSSEQSDNDDEEEEGNKSKSNEHFSTTTEKLTFTKKLQGENGEADIRKRFLVNSLDIETKPSKPSRNQIKSKDYGENLHNLDYLDCADLNLVDEGREGIAMKSFSGCNVQDFLKWMKDCKTVLRKTISTKQGSVSSALFAVYTKEAILEFKEKDFVKIIDYSIRCAIESDNCILVSEIVRTYLFDRDIQLQRILQDIKRISPAIIDTILQTVRNLILRKFRNLQNNGIVLSFCWECGKENRLVMVMSYRGKIEMSDRIPNEVLGFKLVLYNFTQPSEEASSVLKSISVSKKTPLPTITETEARELFRKHSNLTMISASPYKSMGYSKGKHIVVEKTCISLFCFYKGYIPYGEERFPKKIGEFEVDVQEGYCYFGAGRSIELGGHIKRVGSGSSGSIGGFVDLPDNKVGLITCAHVVFSPEELANGQVKNEQLSGTTIEVETFDKNHHSYNICGKIVHGDFPPCTPIALFNVESASSDPNVDVALIELHQDIDTFEFRAVTSEQLQSAGFDPRNPPVFSGEAVSLPDPNPWVRLRERIPNKSDSVVKYGAKTGFTIGNLYLNRVHARFVREKLDLPGNSHCAVMCDQIEIQTLPQGQFFEPGDSGSFVFCINPNKTLSCLGMAVGVSTGNSCLVTPIGRVLENVRLGTGLNVRLKPYVSSGRSSQNSSNTPMQQQSNNNTTSPELQLILGELKKMRSDFQREIRTLQCQVKELKDSTTPSSSGHSSSSPN